MLYHRHTHSSIILPEPLRRNRIILPLFMLLFMMKTNYSSPICHVRARIASAVHLGPRNIEMSSYVSRRAAVTATLEHNWRTKPWMRRLWSAWRDEVDLHFLGLCGGPMHWRAWLRGSRQPNQACQIPVTFNFTRNTRQRDVVVYCALKSYPVSSSSHLP